MDKPYNFISDSEPTDEQLSELMQNVLEDVKQRAAKAKEAFEKLQKQQIKEAFEKYKKSDYMSEYVIKFNP